MNGRPLDLRWAAQNVPAILDIWYPGTQGGAAVADLLFGDVAPGGKLPFGWPRSVGQVPLIYSHPVSHDPAHQDRRYWDEASTPLLPFGHGLSYGRFEYSGLSLDRSDIQPGQTVLVSVTVTNTGDRTGDEVAQLYLRQRYGTASRESCYCSAVRTCRSSRRRRQRYAACWRRSGTALIRRRGMYWRRSSRSTLAPATCASAACAANSSSRIRTCSITA